MSAPSESELHWEALLNDLYRRGLKGEHLKLVCHDGAEGLKPAIEMVWPYAQQQRCGLHKVMNIQSNLKRRSHRSEILKEAAGIYDHSRSAAEAWRLLERFFRELRRRIKPVDSFKNIDSAERLLFALSVYANESYFPENAAARGKLPTTSTHLASVATSCAASRG